MSARAQSTVVDWRAAIRELASFERESASPGEHRAAELIAGWLRERGAAATVEEGPAHGGYWWPMAAANVIALAGATIARRGTRRSRLFGALAGAFAAAAIWDDVGGGRLWFRRALLPHRSTWNVVAQTGDPDAERTLVVVAHHDAAHSGLVFHPWLAELGPKLFPGALQRAGHTAPIMYPVWAASLLSAGGSLLGSRRLLGLGSLFALGTIAAMTDIGLRAVVPGANDNLSAVGALLALADALQQEPVEGLRVLLVSTGSEESFMEGMQAFGRRHFPELDPDRTEVLCLECLGGPTLLVLEGEGMLLMRDYPTQMRESLAQAGADAGVELARGLRTVGATDGLIALRAGYPVATLASIDHTGLPLNYHWPTDAPDALHWDSIERAIEICKAFVRARGTRRADS